MKKKKTRVNQVERCLGIDQLKAANPTQHPVEVIRVITGPSYTPERSDSTEVAERKMAEDREVRIFVIGIPAQDL